MGHEHGRRRGGGSLSLVCCGGTIAMVTGDDGLRRPAPSSHVIEMVSDLAGSPVHLFEVEPVDSSQLTADRWPGILEAVRAAAADGDAVVVTHGTDTLAWTAAMLAAAGPWPVPVCLTAANTPAGEPGSDAGTNLAAAVAALRALPASVTVAFAGIPGGEAELFAGGFVTKRAGDGRAFVARGHRVGRVGPDAGVHLERPVSAPGVAAVRGRFDQVVRCVVSSPMWDAGAIGALGAGCDAVALELYACGTTSAGIVEGCRRLVDQAVPVWACPPSPLDQSAYPSTGELSDVGVDVRLDLSVELAAVALADGAGR